MSLEENSEANGEEPTKAANASTNTLGKEVSAKLANIKEIKANIKHNISTLTKKTSDPDKHEPGRFLGEGVSYRAKLIGILEVGDARGDRMCQEALADLKMAIRAAGEHKQRITIHIAIDGLRLRDDKTGDCLYHHPVHKISFIAQDMTDSRAFGYIFGSPDTGHRFFGIKTDKAASQVVISMRDLFQVVFELKKKEIEMAKQHIEQHQIKYGMGLVPEPPQKVTSSSDSSGGGKMRTIAEDSSAAATSSAKETDAGAARKSNNNKSGGGASEAAIADLLDLELELNSIQQGLSQMERITPSDPFGDSFAPPSAPPAKLLPPPPATSKGGGAAASSSSSKKNWFGPDDVATSGAVTESLFSEDQQPPPSADSTDATTPTKTQPPMTELTSNESKDQFDVFTELDPLGTGRSKPYIDKKDFFQELKNPPKKVLKDLVSELPKETSPLFQASFESESTSTPSSTILASSGATNGIIDPIFPVTVSSDPFGDDPFDKTDPFDETSMSKVVFFPNMQTSKDPFDTCFADFTAFGRSNTDSLTSSLDDVDSKHRKSPRLDEGSDSSIHGPLRVSLPPEKQLSTSPRSRNRYGRTSSLVKLPSPKQKSRTRASRQATIDGSTFDRSSPMDGMTLKNCAVISPSPPTVGLLDSAPDPPPRPPATSTTSTPIIKPPPLPPKRQQTGMTPMKQPFRPLQLDYDYIENYETLGSQLNNNDDVKSPPIPVPARRPRYSGGGGGGDSEPAPQRPLKQNLSTSEGSEPEYYLTPFPLLPPPIKKSSSPKPEPSRLEESAKQSPNTSSLDITLSQLSKTGFSDLASTLGMSPTSLSRMTLQELTKCLQNLNEVEKTKSEDKSSGVRNSIFKSEQYSALRESIEEDSAPFKAEFDSHFNSATTKNESATEQSLFDKYAVFRELLEQEKLDNKVEEVETNNVEELNDEIVEKRVITAPLAKSEEIDDLPDNDEVPVPVVSMSVSEDRYAALREINFDDDFIQEEEEEEEDDEEEVKMDRLEAEGRRVGDEEEGGRSRQHSESTESPTATMKEPQSIMETTIIEEDISALEADDDEVPEEVMGEMEMSLPTVAESNESIDKVESPRGVEIVPSLKEDLVVDDEDDEDGRKGLTITNLIEGWAKFDNNEKTSEGNVSPWSIDSKDINKEQFWKERPDRVVERSKVRKGRKHKTPDDDWGGEDGDESEEGWRWDDGPWREENGWSDGESLYDEPPPPVQYHHSQRRGRRRRVSPRRKTSRDPSPWEEEERWEDARHADEYRPKHRGSSLDEDRRSKRRLSPWAGGEPDRRSSRESLAWEEEEQQRYSRRPYRDRRHRRYEDSCYPRSSREYRDQTRRNYQGYYRDRSHESPWEDSEQGEEDSPRCQTRKQAWNSSRGPQDSEEEMYRYSRTSDPRKAQRGNRGKKRGQTSPFEDDFSAHTFQFPSDSKSPGSDVSEQFPSKHLSPDYYVPKKEFGEGEVFQGKQDSLKTKSNRQSPFEDDFTPPETRRYSGRSVSSDASDKSGRKDVDGRCNDDVFIPEYRHRCEQFMSEITAKGRRGRGNLNGDLGGSEGRRHDGGESMMSRRQDESGISRRQDGEGGMCRRQDGTESIMNRRQDAENVMSRRPDSDNVISRRQDAENAMSRRPDSESMISRRQEAENMMSRRQDGESTLSRRQNSENVASRRQDGESTMSRRQNSENVASRRQDGENTMSRRQNSENSMSRRQENENIMSRRQENENMMSRRQDGDVTMSRRQNSENAMSRRQENESMMTRRQDAENMISRRQDKEIAMSRRNDSENMSPLAVEALGRRPLEKHSFSEVESPSAIDSASMRRRLGSDLKSSDVDSPPPDPVRHPARRGQAGDLKFRVSSLRRTDSSSSLRKSESVNIFARNSDPFDDDDFFSADSTTLPRMSGREERGGGGGGGGNATHDPFKWAEAFNAFNFDTSSAFIDEERK